MTRLLLINPNTSLATTDAMCRIASAHAGAEAIVIGGGPLAQAAVALQGLFDVSIIQPVVEAVRLAISRAAKRGA